MEQQKINRIIKVSHQTGVSFDEISKVVDSQFRTVIESMKIKKTIILPHLGKFKFDQKRANVIDYYTEKKKQKTKQEEENAITRT